MKLCVQLNTQYTVFKDILFAESIFANWPSHKYSLVSPNQYRQSWLIMLRSEQRGEKLLQFVMG